MMIHWKYVQTHAELHILEELTIVLGVTLCSPHALLVPRVMRYGFFYLSIIPGLLKMPRK